MTKDQLFHRLIGIAKMDGSSRDPFICCDLVGQDELFSIQEKLATLLLDLGNDIGKADQLSREMPHTFRLEKKT